MKWFNQKNSNQLKNGEKGSIPNNNRLLYIMAMFITGILFVHIGFVQSELITLTQDSWTTADVSSNTTLPADDWSEYSVHDAGVVSGSDLHLESAVHTITQTSNDGALDFCTTENCSTGGGLDGATSVKGGTVISGVGIEANVKLGSIAPPSSEFTQSLLGNLDTGNAAGISAVKKKVYIADGKKGLVIIDASAPSAPVSVGTYTTTGSVKDVAVSGKYAYIITDEKFNFKIIKINNPKKPKLVGKYKFPGTVKSIAVSGKYAYVLTDGKFNFKILKINKPTEPVLVGKYKFSGVAKDIAVSGKHAYVLTNEKFDLKILKINKPAEPVLVGKYKTSGTTRGIAVSGNYAYVADGAAGLAIIDIRKPKKPKLKGTYVTSGKAKSVALAGNFAYVAMGDLGVATIDVTAPFAPKLLATYDTSGKAKDVVALGSVAYVADGKSGLQILSSIYGSGDYFYSGTFESAVMNLGSSAYDFNAIISDIDVPAMALPVGTEISSADSGLLALWHMNSADGLDSTITDSVGSKTGMMYAAPVGTNTSARQMWSQSGNLGSTTYKALEFDGTNDYVSIGNLGAAVQTVMFWINHSSPTAGDEILELNGSQSISIAQTTGNITTSGFPSPTIYVDGSSSSAALTSGWHHVAIVTSTSMVASDIKLGRVVTGHMKGSLDEVAMYSRAVSANEITKIFKGEGITLQVAASNCLNGASNAPNCSLGVGWGDSDTPFIGSDGTSNTHLRGPRASYHFDEGFGSSTADVSGYGHDGTLMVGGSGGQSMDAEAWANGTSQALTNLGGQSLALDGTDDYVSVGDIKSDIKSIELWVNHSSKAFGGVLLELNSTQSIVIATSNKVTTVGFESPTIYVDGSSKSTVLTSGWHHVAVVTNTAVAASDVNLGRVGSQYMDGSMDEVAMYDWALSAKEIKARHNNGFAKAGAVFGGLSSGALDNKQYVKYKAFMGSANRLFVPIMNDVTVGYSSFPEGAGLVSSVFDTEDDNNFLTDISWTEKLAGHDVRVQVATSGNGTDWNYCGVFNCSINDWLDFSTSVGNYYTKSSGNILNNQSADADNDRYIKYKVWLMSNDGKSTPTVDDVAITYDTAHLEVFAPDGTSDSYQAQAGTPFNIIVKAKDSSGNDMSSHDGTRTIKLTSSAVLSDTDSCLSSFTEDSHKTFSKNVTFFSGKATIDNVMLCDASVKDNFTISASETIGGSLTSEADLTITSVEGSEEVTATLYWSPLKDCTNFKRYEAWYGTTSNVTQGIGNKWDDTKDSAMAICSTSTTTITDLLADTKYYFDLFAIDNNGDAVSLDLVDSADDVSLDEETTDEAPTEEEDEIEEPKGPEEERLYEILVKMGDGYHSDPTEDARASYKHGDVVVIMPAGHNWSDTERRSFLIVEMYLTNAEKSELLHSKKFAGKKIKRRAKNIDLKKMGLSKEDRRNMKKRRELRKFLKGKHMSKEKVTKDRD